MKAIETLVLRLASAEIGRLQTCFNKAEDQDARDEILEEIDTINWLIHQVHEGK